MNEKLIFFDLYLPCCGPYRTYVKISFYKLKINIKIIKGEFKVKSD